MHTFLTVTRTILFIIVIAFGRVRTQNQLDIKRLHKYTE